MSRFWSANIADLEPYVPGEQPHGTQLIKLNTNESAYPPSPQVVAAIRAAAGDKLRLYPDPRASELCEVLAAYHQVQTAQVFVGNGSDEVLGFAFMALLRDKGALCFPDISYSFYPVWAKLLGIDTQVIPLSEAYQIDFAQYPKDCAGIIFPNPNAPTGIAVPLTVIEKLAVDRPESVIIVDEAYVDFGAESAVALVNAYPNLLVVRTFSKARGLAGLRVGYAIGHPDLIEGLARVKDSFNSYPLDLLAQKGAVASIQDDAYFVETVTKTCACRSLMVEGLVQLGFEVLPSAANFVLARHPMMTGELAQQQLRSFGIIVRHFRSPRLSAWLRITVGDEQDVNSLLESLKQILTRS